MRGGVTSQGPSAVVICRAAGVAGGNVYTTFETAAAAANAAGPGATLYIDGNVTVEAVAHDLTGIEAIIGLNLLPPTLTIADGATFSSSYSTFRFHHVKLSFAGATPVIVDTGGTKVCLEDYASLVTTGAATAGILESHNGGDLLLFLGLFCSVQGSAGHEAIKLTGTGALESFSGTASIILDDSISGGGAGAATFTNLTAGLTAGGGLATIGAQSGLNAPNLVP